MLSKEQIKKILIKNNDILKKKYRLIRIGLFGSYALSMQTEDSDIDLIVELKRGVGLIQFVRLQEELSYLLWNKKTDLVTESALKPLIKEKILSEVEWVEGY